MVFNPDITKKAVEVIFSCKKNKPYHPDLDVNGIPVAREDHTKHLGAHLDSRLHFCCAEYTPDSTLHSHFLYQFCYYG